MIGKAFLIAAMAAFNFAVMPRSARADQFLYYPILKAEFAKNMYTFGLGEIRKIRAVVCLELFWSVTEISDRRLYKVCHRVVALLLC